MRYIIIIKKTKDVVFEFYAETEADAIIQGRSYLKAWSLNYKKYTLLQVGI